MTFTTHPGELLVLVPQPRDLPRLAEPAFWLSRALVRVLASTREATIVARHAPDSERIGNAPVVTYDRVLRCEPPDGDASRNPLWIAGEIVDAWRHSLGGPERRTMEPGLAPVQQAAELAAWEVGEVVANSLYPLELASHLPAGADIITLSAGGLETLAVRALRQDCRVRVLPVQPDSTEAYYRWTLPSALRQEERECLQSRGPGIGSRSTGLLFFSSYRNFTAVLAPVARWCRQHAGADVFFVTTRWMRRGLAVARVNDPLQSADLPCCDLAAVTRGDDDARPDEAGALTRADLGRATDALLSLILARYSGSQTGPKGRQRLENKLRALVGGTVARLMQYSWRQTAAMERMLRRMRPDVVVMANDWFHWGPALTMASRRLGVPVVSLQDGMILENPFTCQVLSDLHLVCGARDKALLMEWGVPAECLAVVGQPRYDSLARRTEVHRDTARRSLDIPPEALVVLVIENGMLLRWRPYMTRLAGCLQGRGAVIVFRPHPTTPKHLTARALLGHLAMGDVDFRFAREGSIDSLIQASTLVVGSNSTALMEAALDGRPCITVTSLAYGHHRNPFAEMRGVHTVATPDELAEGVLAIADGSLQQLNPQGRWAVGDFVSQLDGRAAERAGEVICRLARERNGARG
jgi:hypothetical protein